MNVLPKRALLVLGILGFIGVYIWVYITWLNPNFEYAGFSYEAPPWTYLILGILLSVIPATWMPIVLKRPSQLILWMLYLTVFIPSMFVPLFSAYRPLHEIGAMMGVLSLGFCIMCIGSAASPLRFPKIRIPISTMVPALWLITFILLAWVISVFAGHLRFVSFGEVYQVIRFKGAEIAEGTGVGYAVMWLAGVLHPYLMVRGLMQRKPLYFMIGAFGQILLYSTAGLKIILLSVVLIPMFYLVLKRKDAPFGLRITWGAVAVFLVLNLANLMVDDVSQTQFMLSALVFLRSFGVTGLTTGQYQNFFYEHQYTYFSHVKGLNLFLDYPYQSPIGNEVGYFYSSNLDYNANAHLWAMDGLAGAGLLGIILVSLLCALAFWIMNSAAQGHNPVFTSLMVCFASFNLCNVSIFTSLFSGGLAFIIAIFYLLPTEDYSEGEESLEEEDTLLAPSVPAGFSRLPAGAPSTCLTEKRT